VLSPGQLKWRAQSQRVNDTFEYIIRFVITSAYSQLYNKFRIAQNKGAQALLRSKASLAVLIGALTGSDEKWRLNF